MNHFHLTQHLDPDRQPEGPHPVEITLSEAASVQPGGWGDHLRTAFEIEILQGETAVLPGGDVRFRFELDNEKAARFRQALTGAMFPVTDN